MRKTLFSILALWLLLGGIAFAQTLGNPIAPVKSAAPEGGHILKASPGALYALTVAIGTTAGYAMVFDSVTVPSDGAVTPILCYPVLASTPLFVNYPWPVAFTTGAAAAFSTTGCFNKTASNAFFSAQVK